MCVCGMAGGPVIVTVPTCCLGGCRQRQLLESHSGKGKEFTGRQGVLAAIKNEEA